MKTKKTSGLKASIAALEEKPTVKAYVEETLTTFNEPRFEAMCSKTFEVSIRGAFNYPTDKTDNDLAIDRCPKYLDESCPKHTHVHA